MSPSPARAAAVAALLVAGLAACATAGTPEAPAALDGAEWRLVEIGGRPAIGGLDDAPPFLRFATDSARVTGNTGCNLLSGPFTREDTALRFGAIVSTRRACADEARNAQERDLMAALVATERHTVHADTLTLLGADAALARFVARR